MGGVIVGGECLSVALELSTFVSKFFLVSVFSGMVSSSRVSMASLFSGINGDSSISVEAVDVSKEEAKEVLDGEAAGSEEFLLFSRNFSSRRALLL